MRLTTIIALLMILSLTGCGDSASKAGIDSTNSDVRRGSPLLNYAQAASGIATNSKLVLYFVAPMNITTLNSTNIILKDSALNTIPLLIEPLSNSVTLSPQPQTASVFLDANTTYTLTLKKAISYDSGMTLDQDYIYEFTTGGYQDNSPLLVQGYSPDTTLSATSIYAVVSYTFSKEISPSGIDLRLNDVPMVVTAGPKSILARPASLLDYNTTYTVGLYSVSDLAGNKASHTFTFTTQVAPTSLSSVDINNSTGLVLISQNNGFFAVPSSDSNSSFVTGAALNGSTFIPASNYALSYSTPTTTAVMYDDNMFTASNNVLGRHDFTVGIQEENITFDKNISFIYADDDLACLVSKDSPAVDFYGIYELSNYMFHSPAYVSGEVNGSIAVTTPTVCHISKVAKRAYVAQTSDTVRVYTYVNDSNISLTLSGTIAETNVTSIANSETTLFLATNSSIKAYGEINGTLMGSLDLNVGIGMIKTYNNILYAASVLTNEIFVINTKSMTLQHIIPTSAIVKTFDFYESFLVAGYVTASTGRALELFDVSSLNIAPVTKTSSAGTIYKIRTDAYSGYTVAVGSSVTLFDSFGKMMIAPYALSAEATDVSVYTDTYTVKSYIAVAKRDQSVEILALNMDPITYFPTSITSERNITTSGNVNAISAFELDYMYIKLFLGVEGSGLLGYDITDLNVTPILEHNDTDFTAINDLTIYIKMDPPLTRLAVSDFGAKEVKILDFNTSTSYSLTHTFAMPASPRSVHIDPTTGHIFVALGSKGIMGIDLNTSVQTLLSTPGFAMDIDSGIDYYDNQNFYNHMSLVVADFTGTTLFYFDDNTTTLSSTNLYYTGFIPQEGAQIYSTIFLKDYSGYTQGAISVSRDGGIYDFGRYDGLTSDASTSYLNPLWYIDFNATTVPISDYYDPFF